MPLTEADLLTEEEHQAAAREPKPPAHPLCAKIRALRKAAGVSLMQFEEQHGIPSVVIGAYERGDRIPTVLKLDRIFRVFGYRLDAVPLPTETTDGDTEPVPVIRPEEDLIAELRAIADQLEARQ